MTIFWIIAFAIAAIVGFALIAALLRGGGSTRSAADYDIAVYRDQLAEIERDLRRGVIDSDTAARTRTEVSRRILDADRNLSGTNRQAPRAATLAAAGLALAVIIGGSLLLYSRLGAPGYGDLPLTARLEQSDALRENRPSQDAAEAQAQSSLPRPAAPDPQHADLVEKLRQAVAERPNDLQGLTLLVQHEARLGNFTAAHEAQRRRLALMGDDATAADWADYADLLVIAAGGYVSPQAEEALDAVMSRDPANGVARYYSGLLFAQTGRPDKALGIWRQLLETSRPDDPWVPPVRAQIADAAARAGIRYDLPPAAETPPGPSREQVEAAQEMTPQDRMAMIQGMVDNLSARLATDGGTAEEWARLVAALGVLGEISQARAIWSEGQQVFEHDEAALRLLDEAADRAGLTDGP